MRFASSRRITALHDARNCHDANEMTDVADLPNAALDGSDGTGQLGL
jgi:hypothetical protein